jgi:hypothetical protein
MEIAVVWVLTSALLAVVTLGGLGLYRRHVESNHKHAFVSAISAAGLGNSAQAAKMLRRGFHDCGLIAKVMAPTVKAIS